MESLDPSLDQVSILKDKVLERLVDIGHLISRGRRIHLGNYFKCVLL